MRIHIKVSSYQKVIPFNHQPLLTGVIHKWLGKNNEHGEVSLYSFSQLIGGKVTPKGFSFDQGSSFFFSAHDKNLIIKMISGIRALPEMFNGLEVTDILIQEDPDFKEKTLFHAASPIFLKRRDGEKVNHILFDDPRANEYLKETLETKMRNAGLQDETLSIVFDRTYPHAKTKKITYNGIHNRANWCPVAIEGKPETKLFAWNVGLGNSTGIGFGAIK